MDTLIRKVVKKFMKEPKCIDKSHIKRLEELNETLPDSPYPKEKDKDCQWQTKRMAGRNGRT